ncbi:MAG: hypothetical protein Q8O87_03545 [bacterium]|nr:hypothetical protein [bacterium]
MKTFFFVIPKIGRANFILGTNIFWHLKNNGHRLIIFSPFDDADFKKKYDGNNIVFLPLVKESQSIITKISLHLRELALTIYRPHLRKSILILKSITAGKALKPSSLEPILRLVSWFILPIRKLIMWLFNRWEEIILRRKDYLQSFNEYNPSAVILGTHGSDINDVIFLAHCRIKKVASIVVDFPWSYLDNRMYAYPRPITKYALWNDGWKEELMTTHRIPEKNLEITSSARYDYYVNEFEPENRESFLQKIGANPQKRLITFGTLSNLWHPFQPEVIVFMLEAIKNGRLPRGLQLRVRLSPGQDEPQRYFDLLKQYPELMLEEADKLPDRNHLTNLFWHSDVTMTVGSSLGTDSCALDKPMIYIGWNGNDNHKPSADVLKLIFEQNFLRQAIDTGGVKIAWTGDQLLQQISDFLQNPNSNQKERAVLIKKFLGKVDGKAGERIAKVVLSS